MLTDRLWESRWLMIGKEVLNTTCQQETYHLYLCSRVSKFKSTLIITSWLQQPSPRHPWQHSQDHTMSWQRMEPTTRGVRDSSDQLRKHSHLVKLQSVSFPAATSWSGPDERSRDWWSFLLCKCSYGLNSWWNTFPFHLMNAVNLQMIDTGEFP